MQRNRNSRFAREVDGKVVTVVGLALASFMVVTALAVGDTIDQVAVPAIGAAHAAPVATATPVRLAVPRLEALDAENGTWAADESAQGTQPDRAH